MLFRGIIYSVIVMKGISRTELVCAIIFFVSALLCGVWFLLYSYFAVPEITLIGDNEVVVKLNGNYEEKGATATLDNEDVSDSIKIDSKLDTTKVGDYVIKYTITNSKGMQKKTVSRLVKVRDDKKPQIKLKGKSLYEVQFGTTYNEPGYTALDNYDGDISDKVKITGEVNTNEFGLYKLYYTVTDSSENSVTKIRTVKIVDTTAPKITLTGKKKVIVKLGADYKEKGYTAYDNHDGDITNKVKVSGKIKKDIAGVYELTYTVTDSFGNKSFATRKVQMGTQSDIDSQNYIIISINSQTLQFYKRGQLQLSTNVVTGNRGVTDTPRGSFRIQGKAQNIYLTGPDYRSFVNYWMPIAGEIGMHDASWRSSFGGSIYQGNGSHGCINMPGWAAQSLYYNAPIGILVRVV